MFNLYLVTWETAYGEFFQVISANNIVSASEIAGFQLGDTEIKIVMLETTKEGILYEGGGSYG